MSETVESSEIRPSGPRNWFVAWVALLVVVIAGASWYIWLRQPANPLPASVVGGVSYGVYYPKPVPSGYGYEAGSARLEQGGIIVYELGSGDRVITITEQPLPPSPPDLSHLTGFSPAQVPAGYAAYGQAAGRPSAIILAPSALITLAGTSSVPVSDLHKAAESLSALHGSN